MSLSSPSSSSGSQTGLASKFLDADHNDRISNIQLVPKLVTAFMKLPVKMVSCGYSHTGVVTMNGQVWMWGDGGCGQLGYGKRVTRQAWPKMTLAACPKTGGGERRGKPGHRLWWGRGLMVRRGGCHAAFVTVSCGWAHTLALTGEGQAYSWGLNNYGQLGLGDERKRWSPEAISTPPPSKDDGDGEPGPVIDVQAVGNSSGALTREGWVYTWGSSKHGKLNHGDCLPQSRPKPVRALKGQYVTRFVMTDSNLYSFAPAQVRSISLSFDPLNGGSELRIFGIGFFDSPHIVVRFKPHGGAMARSTVGTFVSDKATGKKYIAAKTPKFAKAGFVTVEVSLNGKDFTWNGIGYRCYRQPAITSVNPRFSHIRGGTPLVLEGDNIFESKDVVIRFTDTSGNEQKVPGVVVPYEGSSGNNNAMKDAAEDLEEVYGSGYITCVTPAFPSDLPLPIEVRVEVAMNGQYFEAVRSKLPFIYHNVTISSINPPLIPAEGMVSQLQILGDSFFDGITGRVNIYYGEDNLNIKSSTFVTGCENTQRLRGKVPSTRYILGRDDTGMDVYEATLELMTAKEVLIEPFHFHYYNEPCWALRPDRAPYQGGTLIRLTSTDRAIVPTASPLLRFTSADGQWTEEVPATVITTEDGPPREDSKDGAPSLIYHLEAPAPALPDSLRPPQPTPPSLVSLSLSVSLNSSCFSAQAFSVSYYEQPTLKEISPVEAQAGDTITLKGVGLFAISTPVRLRLVGNDGSVLEAEATCEGEPALVTCRLPTPPALPYVVASIGLALDGQVFTSQPLDTAPKSNFRFTFQDPAKAKKKK